MHEVRMMTSLNALRFSVAEVGAGARAGVGAGAGAGGGQGRVSARTW